MFASVIRRPQNLHVSSRSRHHARAYEKTVAVNKNFLINKQLSHTTARFVNGFGRFTRTRARVLRGPACHGAAERLINARRYYIIYTTRDGNSIITLVVMQIYGTKIPSKYTFVIARMKIVPLFRLMSLIRSFHIRRPYIIHIFSVDIIAAGTCNERPVCAAWNDALSSNNSGWFGEQEWVSVY